MDYQKHYSLLIDRARSRILEGYVERHHVLPKCLGGSDDSANIVQLTPEEHFVAHVLLVKIYPTDRNLILAVQKMCRGHKGCRKNKMYGWLKKRFAARMRELNSGSGNSQFGSRWVNDGTKSFKLKKDEQLPFGCFEGRICRWVMPKGVPRKRTKVFVEKSPKPKTMYPKVHGPYIGKDGFGRWIVMFNKQTRKTYTTKQFGDIAQLVDAIGLSPIR